MKIMFKKIFVFIAKIAANNITKIAGESMRSKSIEWRIRVNKLQHVWHIGDVKKPHLFKISSKIWFTMNAAFLTSVCLIKLTCNYIVDFFLYLLYTQSMGPSKIKFNKIITYCCKFTRSKSDFILHFTYQENDVTFSRFNFNYIFTNLIK
jgi:hypothetical protein